VAYGTGTKPDSEAACGLDRAELIRVYIDVVDDLWCEKQAWSTSGQLKLLSNLGKKWKKHYGDKQFDIAGGRHR
jgi:hypothetical protein